MKNSSVKCRARDLFQAQNLQDLPMSLLDRAKDKLGDIKNEITHTWELMGEMRLFDWMVSVHFLVLHTRRLVANRRINVANCGQTSEA